MDQEQGNVLFLSTPSARRATFFKLMPRGKIKFLSTPSARRATQPYGCGRICTGISIHALREEGDMSLPRYAPATAYFYPRPPRGGRLVELSGDSEKQKISIHALREEGDK